jgi:hypothetical protein
LMSRERPLPCHLRFFSLIVAASLGSSGSSDTKAVAVFGSCRRLGTTISLLMGSTGYGRLQDTLPITISQSVLARAEPVRPATAPLAPIPSVNSDFSAGSRPLRPR